MAGGNKKVLSILIAEDDALMKDMYIEWLTELLKDTPGVIISILSNGMEVAGCLMKKKFDITILDVALPVMSGIDLYKKHRDNMGKIVLASSYANVFSKYLNENEKCIILNKPFNKNKLADALKSLPEVPSNANTRANCDSSEYIFI